jgi:DNA-binding transcriptional regulator PaaX
VIRQKRKIGKLILR